MLASYAKAFRQLGDPRLIKPLVYSLGLAALIALLALPAGYFVFEWVNETLLAWLGGGDSWWMSTIEWSVRVLGWLIVLVILFFAFGSIQTAWLGIFMDGVVNAARDSSHPKVELNSPPSLSASGWSAVRFLALSLLVNVMILPLVLIGWILPPLGLIVQLLANGYLLGREYEDLVSPRFSSHRRLPVLSRSIFGMMAATLFLVPFINFVAPVVTAAAFTHYLASRK